MSNSSIKNINSVFYAETYHPIQAGSIDGTDIHPHDNAVCRALLCSSSGLYDPFGDPKVIGVPYCTIFVGRLSHFTTEETLRQAMSKYGRVKNLRLVRHIVTGASRGYAFVEFETEREMRRAYMDAHHTFIDDSEILVDYNRQQLMPGWIPRRLGGGLGGKKESGQLRFGGRERPFRAPLRQIPYDDLIRLGIPAPPEGRYMARAEVPSPPRRKRLSIDRDDYHRHGEESRYSYQLERSPGRRRRSRDRPGREDYHRHEEESRDSYQLERSPGHRRRSRDRPDGEDLERSLGRRRRSRDRLDREDHHTDEEERRDSYQLERSPSCQRRSRDRPDRSSKRHKSSRHSSHGKRSRNHDHSSEDTSSLDRGSSHQHRRYSRRESDRWSPRRSSTLDD